MKDIFFDFVKTLDYAYISNYVQSFMKMGGIYVVYSFLHYTIPHIYTHFCVPQSIFGFFMSPLMAQSPHCIGLRWTLFTVGDNLKTMFALLAGWLYNILFSGPMRP